MERSPGQMGGRRPGAGRKKSLGSIAKERARVMMEIAISNHVNEIVSVQLRAALGSHVLYKRASPNPIKVTNKREIAMFMAGSLDRKLYYDIELKTPNWSVGTDLLNRLFGMPRQTVDIPSDPYRPIFALPSDRLVAMAPPKKDPT